VLVAHLILLVALQHLLVVLLISGVLSLLPQVQTDFFYDMCRSM
jgi:hypothetical protein